MQVCLKCASANFMLDIEILNRIYVIKFISTHKNVLQSTHFNLKPNITTTAHPSVHTIKVSTTLCIDIRYHLKNRDQLTLQTFSQVSILSFINKT